MTYVHVFIGDTALAIEDEKGLIRTRHHHLIIWIQIVDPGALGETAHQAETCAGTHIEARVIDPLDALRLPTITASDSLECSPYTGCSGIIGTRSSTLRLPQTGGIGV